jgi:hypothetical protein
LAPQPSLGLGLLHKIRLNSLEASQQFSFLQGNKTVILPAVLYGCETWSLTLRKIPRLRVFEKRVLRRIFGPKREEDGTWRKLHNDELRGLYSSANTVRVIE